MSLKSFVLESSYVILSQYPSIMHKQNCHFHDLPEMSSGQGGAIFAIFSELFWKISLQGDVYLQTNDFLQRL